jgi:hypothetical protein
MQIMKRHEGLNKDRTTQRVMNAVIGLMIKVLTEMASLPCKSKPRFIFLFKRLFSGFKKFEDAIIMKKSVIRTTKVILNFEKCNT